MRKDILMKKLARLEEKKNALAKRCESSTDLAEVRSLTETLADLNAEIEETRSEIAAIDAEEQRANATVVNSGITASFGVGAKPAERSAEEKDMEYRKAFMAYIQKGVEIPSELRNGTVTNTANAGAAIPVTVMNEVINTVRKRYGNLYSKVRKLNVPGGVEIPVGSLQATFKWVNESTVSPRQKAGSLGKVSFGYHTAEIRVAQTFLSQILSLTAFEAELTKIIAIAYLQAIDEAIVKGSGDGMPLGILNDARVTNVVEMTAADFDDWTKWRKKFFSKLPLGYRDGEFIFPLSTVEAHLETMADSNNNPIFRQATGLEVNDGDAVNPNGRFFGREISLVEPDILPDFDTANANDIVGIYWQPEQYGINENFGFTMRRYFDEETNEWVDKAIVVVDGKVINPTGYYLIKKVTA